MKRKKIQKLITTVLTIAFFTNSMSTFALGLTKDDAGKSYTDLVDSLKKQSIYNEQSYEIISKDIDTSTDKMVSVIVEFISEPLAISKASTYKSTETKVDRDHRLFETYLSNLPSTYNSLDELPSVEYSYKTIFNGVALKIKGTDIEALTKSGVVKRIHNNAEVVVEPPIEEVIPEAEDSEIAPFMMDSVPKLGIDKLHKENIKGQGIKVGVLDTGIDYNHPDLTNAYEGFRAKDGDPKNQDINTIKGWDFVDNDADPMETTYDDWKKSNEPEFDPRGNSYYTSHGTHVSGTIAGTSDNSGAEFSVLGVAPEVELYGYRVLGKYGSGSTAGIIGAIEKSVTDGMDVINMSLGASGNNGPYDPMVAAVNNATKAGVTIAISNGNAGPNNFTVGSPGVAQLPIAVGASTVDITINNYGLSIGDLDLNASLLGPSYTYSIEEVLNQELEIVYCGLGSTNDFKGKDLTGKIALIDRGTHTFLDKSKNAYNAGAKAVIIANNDDSTPIPYLGEDIYANILGITKADGEKLKKALTEKITITYDGESTILGDEVTGFSSVGPVRRTYEIRPDIVAPGSMVFSTVPEYIRDKNESEENYNIAYQRMSGTSMSSPHIAGIAALILQANPNYTPEEVKLAIMNTSEQIFRKDGANYSVHEAGAGRVNAYEAVHEEVTFSSEYEVTYGEAATPTNNITGMLSYGRIVTSLDGSIDKKLPVTVTNNSKEAKNYTITVEYSSSPRAANANNNGFELNLPTSVEVAPGESKTFEVSLPTNVPTAYGTYEGYIHFTEANDSTSTYQMPFSVSIMKDGFATLTYPEVSAGFAQGITAFTCSDQFRRNPQTYYGFSDISFLLQVNNEIRTIECYVVDPETKERLGFVGKDDARWIPTGVDVLIEGIASNGKARKLVNGKVSHEEFPLETGIYDLEVVATEYDGKQIIDYLPMAAINDTHQDVVTYNMEEGVIEVTEDMYTTNTWFDGKDYEAIWLKANVYNDIVNQLKTEHGLSFLQQDQVNIIFANGIDRSGWPTQMGTMPSGNGDILVAGVERSDIEDGFFRAELTYTNAGKIMNKPVGFTFVDKNKSYLTIDTDTDTLIKGSTLTSSISVNNAENLSKGSFSIQVFGDANYSNLKIVPSEELKKIAGDNIKTNIEFEVIDDPWSPSSQFNISFEITSEDFKGINGDMKLFDMITDIETFNGISEDLSNDENFVYTLFRGVDGEFFNTNNEAIDVMAGTIYKTLDVEYTDRTLIYLSTTSPLGGMIEANAYVMDQAGNRYEPTYSYIDDWMGRGHLFTFNELPVIDGDYKVILEMPGCFDSIMNIPGSRLTKNNNRVGNTFGIISSSFMAPSLISYGGDVNGDGAIDIIDANEIAKEYVPGEEHWMEFSLDNESDSKVTDFNHDGVVNYYDMFLVLSNYLMQDLTREDSKVPEEYIDGRDIVDILESCGYYDEVPEKDIKLNINTKASIVGDTVNLSVTPPPATEGVPFEYEFAVREKNHREWTVIGERSSSKDIAWVSDAAGEYEFRARIFLDEIEYVWQDNTTHTVEWAATESVLILHDNLVDGTLNVKTGDNSKLEATINPWNAKPQDFMWNSSDKSIVTVDSEGNLTAVKEGTATITATTCDKQFSATIEVNVSDIAVESIELNKSQLDIKIGQSEELTVAFNPENATNKNVTWSSDNDKVVKVVNGTVVGLKAGTATVTVTSEDGNFTASCVVNVTKVDVHVESVELDKENLDLTVGDSETLTATVKPENADNKNVIWTSADEKVATVENGKVVAVSAGTTTITVTSEDGKLTDTCEVKVTEKEVPPTKPEATKIKLNKDSAKLNVGDKLTLKATVSPEDAEMPELVWSSSDEKIATVKDGVVTALKAGKVKITVTSKDGKLSDTCSITVSKKDGKPDLPQTGALVGSSLLAVAGLGVLGVGAFVILKKKKEEDDK